MATRLIVNADDFGLTQGVNRAIAELHAAGAVTSATLMANGAAFSDAITVAHANTTLGVGCHVVLVDGTPISAPGSVPTLLSPDRRSFRTSLVEFHLAVLRGHVSAAEITLEATAQIERLQSEGIAVTHLDTHKHTHILPQVARALLLAAERTGVRAIRNPFEQPWSLRIGRTKAMRRLQVALMTRLQPRFLRLPQITSGAVRTTAGTLGISATGRLDAEILRATLSTVPEGTWELVCHPGYNDADLASINTRLRDTRDVERRSLLEVFTGHHYIGPSLIHYGTSQHQRPWRSFLGRLQPDCSEIGVASACQRLRAPSFGCSKPAERKLYIESAPARTTPHSPEHPGSSRINPKDTSSYFSTVQHLVEPYSQKHGVSAP